MIDQFWFEYELHVSSCRIQIFESLSSWHILCTQLNFWISFQAHLSLGRSRVLLHVAITLFSPAHPHAHFMCVCHTLPIIIHYTVFIISHVSTVLWFHSVPKLSFSPPHTVSTRLSLCLSLYGILSHTLYVSTYDSYH